MKNFAKILSVAALAIASASIAHADVITFLGNSLTSNGTTSFSAGSNTLLFGATNIISPAPTRTGTTFNAVASGPTYVTNPFTFTVGATLGSAVDLFSFTEGIATDQFYVTSSVAAPGGDVILEGYITGGSFGAGLGTPASYDITILNTGGYISSLAVPPVGLLTPEPNSLVLLGTGLVSAAGMMIRKRRIA